MKQRQLTSTLTAIILVLFAWMSNISAQDPKDKEATKVNKNSITSLRFVDVAVTPSNATGVADPYIIVNLSDKLNTSFAAPTQDMTPSNFNIKFLPSGRIVPVSAILPAQGLEGTFLLPGYDDRTFQIELDGRRPETKPLPGDTQVELTVLTMHFADGTVKSNLKTTGRVYNESNKNTFTDDLRVNAKKAAASAKTSDEKNIFAGLNIAVPSGGNGKTEGNADIHFNKTLYGADIALPALFDQITVGLHLKKGSENRADPRHFETGLTMRKTFLLIDRKALNKLRNDINGAGTVGVLSDGQADKIQRELSDLQRGFFRAILFDNAFRFEGDVKGLSVGNVSNLLYATQVQVSTVSQSLGNGAGFFNLRLIPVGLEAGYNITNNDVPNAKRQSLARIKAGAQFNLHYQASNPNDFLNRVEWEIKGVNRYLFRREAAFDETTKTAIFTDKGNKYWIQSDLKFLFGGISSLGRAGFKLTFNRGSLPPVYAFNKAFTFGLVFESGDDDTSKEIKLR